MLALDTALCGAQKAHVLAFSKRAQGELLRRCSGSYVSHFDGKIRPGISPVHAAIIMHVLQALQNLIGNGGDELFWHAVREPACHRQSLAPVHLTQKTFDHVLHLLTRALT